MNSLLQKSILVAASALMLLPVLETQARPGQRDRGDIDGRINVRPGRDMGWDNDYDNDRFDRRGSRERVVLRMHDAHYTGRNSKIMLKQEMKRQTGLIPRNYELMSVRLVAKSKRGMGQAELMVAQRSQDSSRIYGTPEDFHQNYPGSYDRISLRNFDQGQQGPWQIHLKGNIKVKRVVLLLKKKMNHGRMIEVHYGDQHFQGRGNKLFLKRAIKQQNPHIDLSNFDLKSITLIAKTRMGRGQATLLTANREQDSSRVGGSPDQFHSSRPYSFDQVTLHNYDQGIRGPWQIELRGNFKVRSVKIKLKRKNNGGWD